MKSLLFVILLLMQNAFAHHQVEFITNNQKIIITKDFNEEVKGNKIEVYHKNASKSKIEGSKVTEHFLPKIGDRVKIYRIRHFYSNNRMKIHKMTKELVGTATVASLDVKGESVSALNLKKTRSTFEILNRNLSQNEIEKINKDSIVAIPDNGIRVEKGDIIEF